MKRAHVVAVAASVIVGSAYYIMMEMSIPTEANCSYLATPMTDYLAFLWGFIVSWYGLKYDNPILTGGYECRSGTYLAATTQTRT